MTAINMIAGIGKRGQIGVRNRPSLPWPHKALDLRIFQQVTKGAVCIAGMRTVQTLPTLPSRVVIPYTPRHPSTVEKTIENCLANFDGWPIWVIGGAQTYRDFAPFIDGAKILSAVDYDNDPAEDLNHIFFPFDAYGITWPGVK